jgi:ClpX C4-type zinc finger
MSERPNMRVQRTRSSASSLAADPLPVRPLTEMSRPKAESPRCSFCGKTSLEVLKLVAGPSALICDECVDICNTVIAEAKTDSPEGAPRVFTTKHLGSLLRCRLCQALFESERCVTFPGRGCLCVGCVEAVRLNLGTGANR